MARGRHGEMAVTWESGAITSPDEVRVECTAMGPPKLLTMLAATLVDGQIDILPSDLQPRPVTRGVHRMVALDPRGVRHLDQTPRRAFLKRAMNPRIDFAVPWVQLGHIGLQVQRSRTTPLQMLRMILGPLNPAEFSAHHPDLEILRNLTGLSPDYWAISLGVNDHVDQQVMTTVCDALRRFAGPRFPGVVTDAG